MPVQQTTMDNSSLSTKKGSMCSKESTRETARRKRGHSMATTSPRSAQAKVPLTFPSLSGQRNVQRRKIPDATSSSSGRQSRNNTSSQVPEHSDSSKSAQATNDQGSSQAQQQQSTSLSQTSERSRDNSIQPRKKKAKTHPHDRMLDEYADDVFWERLINNQELDWSMITRTLDNLISQWRSFKSSAAQTTADWRRIESGAVKFESERRKQAEANALLRCARRYDELLTRIGSRFIAISLMSTEVIKKAKVPLQQREDRVREAIVNMRQERRSLRITMNDIEDYLDNAADEDQRQHKQFTHENELLHEQIRHLRQEKQQLQERVAEIERDREQWRGQIQQHEDVNQRLRSQIADQERAHNQLRRQLQDLERQLDQIRRPAHEMPRNEQRRDRPQHDQRAAQNPEQQDDQRNPEEQRRDLRRQIRQITRQIQQLEEARAIVPARNLQERFDQVHPAMQCVFCRAEGQHFSDACPFVSDPQQRRNIIRNRGRCKRCLEHCERRNFCAYENRECSYCSRARGTVLYDEEQGIGPHHAALCRTPDDRARVYFRIQELRQQREQKERELKRL
ncbi:unnamed protein product [Nippostrongylus brasiliensis]|uniref:CCHC-type domain-containing protein n=1 Tax=Nippostrongylus brasiliensis TaxID=27835 RepID=A0A0N4YVH5_NIPBR|nr:unnamed protein product [Nippostrongylus brasiliensis]